MKKSKICKSIFVILIMGIFVVGCGSDISQEDTSEIMENTDETVVEEEKSTKVETTVDDMKDIGSETAAENVENVDDESVADEILFENEESTDSKMVDETLASDVEEQSISDSESDPILVKNVPVGTNPVVMPWYSSDMHRYVFTDESWVEIPMNEQAYMAETTDEYGITYIEYKEGTNEIAMQMVAEYVQKNPESNFEDIVTNYGNEIVVVTSWLGLWDDTYDYEWNWNIVDCEPEDCLYMFVAGSIYDPGYDMERVWDELLSSVSDSVVSE